ncbi:hypothetical protein ACHAWF_013962, partial [Thalassiosira exigua]
QLDGIPAKYLSSNRRRPLLFLADDGGRYKYALKPLTYSVLFVLLIEALERFSYAGIASTKEQYLIGGYNPEWNANMTSVQASSFVSGSTALANVAPFIGGIVADGVLGDYYNILFGATFLYLPGLLLIALCSYPYALGQTFDLSALRAGMLVLYPLGAGFIKAAVNVLGAKQFHPILQKDFIESYYVWFYCAINVGALAGGIIVPVVAKKSQAAAYTIPCVTLVIGLIIFLCGSGRYVRAKPRKKALWASLGVLLTPVRCKSINSNKILHGGDIEDHFVDGVKSLLTVIPATSLILPFMVAYNQSATVYILQGQALESAGFIDASMMSNFDPISVLVTSMFVQYCLNPALAKRGIRLKLAHKFAIGTALGALSVLNAIVLDYCIHRQLQNGSKELSVMWQISSFVLLGVGEIFPIAVSYDITFTIAPKE